MSARTRRLITSSWAALFVFSLLMQYASFAAPAASLAANSSGSKLLGGFEIDGDFPASSSLAGDDWSNAANTGSGLVSGPAVQDPFGTADASVLSNGVSDGDPLTDWQMNGSAGAPQKADIGNVYFASRPIPQPPVTTSHFWAYIGVERKASTGTVQYDIEFNKLGNRTNTHGVSVPNRSTGDLLFTGTQQGGGSWTILGTVQTWTGAWDTGSWSAPVAVPATTFYGLANEFDALHPASWPDALGSTVPSNQFAEMAIDVSAALPGAVGCPGFGTMNLRSISSTGTTPELKDVVAPLGVDVSNCASLAWQKQDDSGHALGGATFTISPNPWTGTGSVDIADYASANPQTNKQADQDGRAGYFKLIDVEPGTYTVVEKSAPNGYIKDSTSEQITLSTFEDGSIGYIWKNAPIASPSLTTSLVGGTTSAGKSSLTLNLGSASSVSFSDSATFASTNANHLPTGSVVYHLYDATCANELDSDSVTIGANGAIPNSKTFTLSAVGTYNVKASYAGDTYNQAAGNSCGDEVVTVVKPNIVVHKSVDKTVASPGDTLHYTITIQNDGTGTANGVSFTDAISGITAHGAYQNDAASSQAPTPSYSAPNITWSGDIAAKTTVTITFSVKLDATFPSGTTHLPNTAVVAGTGSNCASGSTDTACSTDTTVTAAPVLNLVKEVKVNDGAYAHTGTANPGDTLTYRITISNTGDANATNESVTDSLASLLAHGTWNADAAASSGTVTFTSPDLSWTGITVPAGGTATLTFSITLSTSGWVAGTTDLPNTAIEANSQNCASAATASADCSTDTTVTTGTDLRITKAVAPTSIGGGKTSSVSYTIVVSNAGNGATNGDVLVTDNDFPAFYSISGVVCAPTNGTCDAAHLTGAGIDLGPLAAGASVTITVTGSAAPNNTSDVGPHTNTAFACEQVTEGQAVCVHAPAVLTVLLTPQPSLGITKGVSLSAGGPFVSSLTGLLTGTTVYYQIVVSNTGNVDLSSFQLSDSRYALASLGCTTPATLAVGASFTCSYHVSAPDGTTPNTATASAVYGETAVGPVQASATIEARTPALTIAKSFTGNTLPPLTVGGTTVKQAAEGDTLTYTLAYTLASGPVHNAVVTDVLPAGQTYVSGSAAGNDEFTFQGYDAGTRTLTWTAVTATKSGTVTYRVTIDKGANALTQPLTNSATIRSDETAPDSATADVFVPAPPKAITQPPTDTLPTRQPGSPGFSLMLLLLALAGFALALGFVTPVPERVRRDRD